MARAGWAFAAVAVVAIVVVGVVLATTLLGLGEPEPDPLPDVEATLRRPAPGEVRADHLADGTPVWIVGDADGEVRVLSAFDRHTPGNVGKLVWWCTTAEGFEDVVTSSKYDVAGAKIDGPAPSGLPSYAVEAFGGRLVVGQLGEAPPVGTPRLGPPTQERRWCMFGAGAIIHTFEGWPVHRSPTEAVASAPSGWILLAGELSVNGGVARLCALGDCSDAVIVAGTEAAALGADLMPWLLGDRWIARVRDGALVDLTRVPSRDAT